ncbi:MAG: cupin domain-containing protein [Pseudomonadota bacterium]|nr:cupin domain-containing protein [Pseudomonadota bacterium]MEC8619347.1 cupin domain-containing protein [Pseudomonadota bacterium]
MGNLNFGEAGADEFLQEYWQQKPLLIRQALPGYISAISPDELAGLALEEEVESRLVVGGGNNWSLRHGPFTEQDFLDLPQQDWTLLVQAVDLWVPQVQQLLELFAFLPLWRLDDVMVSFACPGGSVGPHFDQYDVFLLQVAGTRRWQIGGQCDGSTPLKADCQIRMLESFSSREEWLLEPGDMLYLPPGIAHWGVAESECLTYSIGFRSPNIADLLADLAVELMAQGYDAHYRDPAMSQALAGPDIAQAFVAQAKQQLWQAIDNDDLIGDWFARFMTAPKYPELVEMTQEERRANWRNRRYCNGDVEGDTG